MTGEGTSTHEGGDNGIASWNFKAAEIPEKRGLVSETSEGILDQAPSHPIAISNPVASGFFLNING